MHIRVSRMEVSIFCDYPKEGGPLREHDDKYGVLVGSGGSRQKICSSEFLTLFDKLPV